MRSFPILNMQPIEKKDPELSGKTLDVQEIFYTIQGEGPLAGEPAVFVRLAGCNLQCPGCDTDYTSSREIMTVEEIIAAVNACANGVNMYHQPAVVITGGEPFRQNLSLLVEQLDYDGITVQIETNGTLPIPRDVFDRSMIVCSPKTGKVATPAYVHAWKYVMHHESIDPEDGLPTRVLDHSVSKRVARKNPNGMGSIYLQPMDSRDPEDNKKSLDACVQSCMKFGYTLCLQIHKIANLP